MAVKASSAAAPLVLVFGDDDYGVKGRAKEIHERWCVELGGMDHEVIDAQAGNSGEACKALGRLRESMQTLPFFGGAKAIWFRGCNFLGEERAASAQAVTEGLAELVVELKRFGWENVRLLISAGKVDKRKSLYKTVEKLGTVQNFAAWSMEDKGWVVQAEGLVRERMRAVGKEIAEEALGQLVSEVGPNRRELANEVEKLSLYLGDKAEAELEDVEAVVTRQKQTRAFALGDALGERDLVKVMRRLDEELWGMRTDSKKTVIGLLYGLITKVRMMIFLKEMVREKWVSAGVDFSRFRAQLQRVPAEELPEDKRFNPLSMNPYPLFKGLGHASRYSGEELVEAMGLLLECNRRLVLSQLDEALVLQQALVRIVRGAGKPVVREEELDPRGSERGWSS